MKEHVTSAPRSGLRRRYTGAAVQLSAFLRGGGIGRVKASQESIYPRASFAFSWSTVASPADTGLSESAYDVGGGGVGSPLGSRHIASARVGGKQTIVAGKRRPTVGGQRNLSGGRLGRPRHGLPNRGSMLDKARIDPRGTSIP